MLVLWYQVSIPVYIRAAVLLPHMQRTEENDMTLISDDRTRTICYNTCCEPGCYNRIAYEKGEVPEKYCNVHNKGRDKSNLIPTKPKTLHERASIQNDSIGWN